MLTPAMAWDLGQYQPRDSYGNHLTGCDRHLLDYSRGKKSLLVLHRYSSLTVLLTDPATSLQLHLAQAERPLGISTVGDSVSARV